MTDLQESGLHGFIASFADLWRLPRAFWIVIGVFVLESSAYFGVLTLMTPYLSQDLNWINPAIIFVGVPIATALTRQVNVYRMMVMVIGSLASAVPTFLLCGGPNLSLLITCFVVVSIGEAL